MSLGYGFTDPLAPREPGSAEDPRAGFYVHGWQGHSGHSVWVDQGRGRARYDPAAIKQRMLEQFDVALP